MLTAPSLCQTVLGMSKLKLCFVGTVYLEENSMTVAALRKLAW